MSSHVRPCTLEILFVMTYSLPESRKSRSEDDDNQSGGRTLVCNR